MQNYIFRYLGLVYCLFFCVSSLSAQTITEGLIEISKQEQKRGYAFQVNVPERVVEKAVINKLKSIKARYQEKKGVFRAEKNILDSISTRTIDLIVVLKSEKNDVITISTVVDLGMEAFVDSKSFPKEDANIRRWLGSLHEEIKLQYLIYQLGIENQEMEDLQKKLRKMGDNQTQMQKNIDTFLQKIEENKKNMEKNAQDMELQKTKIAEKQKAIDDLKNKTGSK